MEDQALFRLFNPLSPTTRRTTRVLQEMQAQRGINGIFALDDMRISNSPTLTTLTPPPTRFSELQTHYFKTTLTTSTGEITRHLFQRDEDSQEILMTHLGRKGPLTRW